jgi:hypothetical protein
LTSTGFKLSANANYEDGNTKVIYIAIRRPMKPPTTGTEVYTARSVTEDMNGNTVNLGITSDLVIVRPFKNQTAKNNWSFDRLRGMPLTLRTDLTNAELNLGGGTFGAGQTSVTWPGLAASGELVQWIFKRAPGFFDVVCYTGTGSARTVAHNLTVAPELMIVKRRNSSSIDGWYVYSASLPAADALILNQTGGTQTIGTAAWNSTRPTSSVFSIGDWQDLNASGGTYVNYLFASTPGVSKVGTYTGTGTTNAINCGFSGGARFVMIKRTDSTGDWYVWDTARGIVSGNDPYLLMNSGANAEVTNTDYIDPSSAGFEISSSAPAAINASGGTFIYLAIA